jgi:hypothetical protein
MAASSPANDFRPHPLSLKAADITRKMRTDSTPSVSDGGQEKTEQGLGFILEIEGQISHMTREHYRKMSLNGL